MTENTKNFKVGDKVLKKSGKPFKSKNKINTVKSITTNPHTNLPAFTFEEDDSFVDIKQLNKVDQASFKNNKVTQAVLRLFRAFKINSL